MPEQSTSEIRRWCRSDWFVIPCMLVMLFAARSSLADHYHVPSGSMEYSIMTGDRVLIDKTAYGFRIPFTSVEIAARGEPQRGDVAVFDSPADGTRLIKRIAAVSGDVVTLRDGLLNVNGVQLAPAAAAASRERAIERFDGHRADLNLASGGGPDFEPMIVPAGKVLALGDHRGNSVDSRYFGLVDAESIYGRALGIYYRRGDGLTWRPL